MSERTPGPWLGVTQCRGCDELHLDGHDARCDGRKATDKDRELMTLAPALLDDALALKATIDDLAKALNSIQHGLAFGDLCGMDDLQFARRDVKRARETAVAALVAAGREIWT